MDGGKQLWGGKNKRKENNKNNALTLMWNFAPAAAVHVCNIILSSFKWRVCRFAEGRKVRSYSPDGPVVETRSLLEQLMSMRGGVHFKSCVARLKK